MPGFLARMLRASLLDTALYEEVETDTRATWQAVGVVCLSSLASGLGSGARDGVGGGVLHTLVVLIAWYAWAYLSYFIGTTVLPEAQTRANHGELLRTLGFSSAPGILRLLGLIPGLTVVVFILVYVWMVVAMVVAVRQALDYTSTARAFAVCTLGGLIILGLILLLVSPLVGGVS
jgi:Yip1-like protein